MQPNAMTSRFGYSCNEYAQALSHVGVPLNLSHSDTFVISRSIGNSGLRDIMGCYPLFCSNNWEGLQADLNELRGEHISLSLVTDPLGTYKETLLEDCFPGRVIPFKRHYIVESGKYTPEGISEHHRRYTRKTKRLLNVVQASKPLDHLLPWNTLYSDLISRHAIKGVAQFTKESFEFQLSVPGIQMFLAYDINGVENQPIGIMIWYIDGDNGYYHLAAYSDAGYKSRASFALMSHSIECLFDNGVKRLNLGGAAGIDVDPKDGLARFKKGWSTDEAIAHLCGCIFQPKQYERLSADSATVDTQFFPAYRANEQF